MCVRGLAVAHSRGRSENLYFCTNILWIIIHSQGKFFHGIKNPWNMQSKASTVFSYLSAAGVEQDHGGKREGMIRTDHMENR